MGWVFHRLKPQAPFLALATLCSLLHAGATAAYPLLLDLLTTRLIGAGAQHGGVRAVRSAIESWPLDSESEVGTWLAEHLLWGFTGVVIVKGVTQAAYLILVGYAGQKLAHRMRTELFEHILSYPPKAVPPSIGDLIARALVDVDKMVVALTDGVPRIINDGLKLFGLCAVCLYFHPRLSLMSLVLIPATVFPLAIVAKRLRGWARVMQAGLGHIANRLAEVVSGLPLVVSFGAEERERERFYVTSYEQVKLQLKSLALRAGSTPLMELVGVGALLAAVVWASPEIEAGRLRPGEVVGFLLAMVLIYEPLKALGRVVGVLTMGWAAIERLRDVCRQEVRVEEGAVEAMPFPEHLRSLQFDGVCVVYPGETQAALETLSFQVEKPGLYAFSGRSGSGKSTALALLNRLIDPSKGRLLWNGFDARSYTLSSLRNRMTVLDSSAHIFEGTVEYNLRYANWEVTQEQMESACRVAGIEELLQPPLGLDGVLGEKGQRLSSGQRQRLALARALLRAHADVMILDEPTSFLDPIMRAHVRALLKQAATKRWVFVATHDLNLLEEADEVFRLDGEDH